MCSFMAHGYYLIQHLAISKIHNNAKVVYYIYVRYIYLITDVARNKHQKEPIYLGITIIPFGLRFGRSHSAFYIIYIMHLLSVSYIYTECHHTSINTLSYYIYMAYMYLYTV